MVEFGPGVQPNRGRQTERANASKCLSNGRKSRESFAGSCFGGSRGIHAPEESWRRDSPLGAGVSFAGNRRLGAKALSLQARFQGHKCPFSLRKGNQGKVNASFLRKFVGGFRCVCPEANGCLVEL